MEVRSVPSESVETFQALDPAEIFSEPRRPRPAAVRSFSLLGSLGSLVATLFLAASVLSYIVLGLGTLIGLVLFMSDWAKADNVGQQAAVGAGYAASFIGAYVVCRSLEKVATLTRED